MNTYKVNKKNNGFGDGFTLVEVIISIVVIVIIASITLISYVGVQNQSKAEQTRTNAGTVKKVAETYYNINNVYPTQSAHFNSTYAKLSDVTIITSGTLTRQNGENAIMYRYISSGAGACIMRWDYFPESGAQGIVVTDLLGTASSGNCNATTGTLPS